VALEKADLTDYEVIILDRDLPIVHGDAVCREVPHWDTHVDSADMLYVGDLLDEANRTLCIDERRVYVSGYSNGAFMASAIACVYADRVAAVATVAGIRDVPGCAPARPVPAVAFHGTADEWVSFTGGLGPSVDALPEPDQQQTRDVAAPTESGLSIPGVAAAWAARNGCGSTPTESRITKDVRVVRYDCAGGADVALYVVEGGGHTWPGSKFSRAIAQFVGPTTLSIDADALLWRFFQPVARQPSGALTERRARPLDELDDQPVGVGEERDPHVGHPGARERYDRWRVRHRHPGRREGVERGAGVVDGDREAVEAGMIRQWVRLTV
jgi:poly(3-hydroxybutyrate) depolymerase